MPYRLHIAGRESCPTGFSMLYSGFLMAEYDGHHPAAAAGLAAHAQGVGRPGPEHPGLIDLGG